MIDKTWKSVEDNKVHKSEDKKVLSIEEKSQVLDELVAEHKKFSERCNSLYSDFSDTDLGSVCLRLEQNITQLKKIKNGLQND